MGVHLGVDRKLMQVGFRGCLQWKGLQVGREWRYLDISEGCQRSWIHLRVQQGRQRARTPGAHDACQTEVLERSLPTIHL